jgi:hypothetical protein
MCEQESRCRGCQEERSDIEVRYSYGYYAGELCEDCARSKYRDNCGLDDGQGNPTDLDEFYLGGYDALDGEEW